MPRVKGGTVTRQRRKKMIKLAKGYRGSKHIQFKVAKQQVMKSYQYAFRDRRKTKSNFRKLWIARINAAARMNEFRQLWIARINAAARMNGLSYSRFMHGLKLAEVDINRKMLAEMAVNDAAAFTALVDEAKKALAK